MNKHGFTLLEVTLFFAVSGLLALVAFAGLGPRLRNVRFTDAVRSIESTTQKQLSNFQSGSNLRTEDISCSETNGSLDIESTAGSHSAGSSAECILNGRLAVIEQDKAVYYPVVSLRKATDPCVEDPKYGKLFCHKPVVIGFSNNITEVEHRNGATADPVIGLLYLQDPNGTETKLVGFDVDNALDSSTHEIDAGDDIISLPSTTCISLSGRTAKLEYNNGSLQPKITFEGC